MRARGRVDGSEGRGGHGFCSGREKGLGRRSGRGGACRLRGDVAAHAGVPAAPGPAALAAGCR
ncbi:hypothetical protein L559_2378 [Bordetella pertussis STO1-CHOC-0017]|nr:hypothetical protein L559_2378 [Bordetella pertussis STO1-CHOC-0017]